MIRPIYKIRHANARRVLHERFGGVQSRMGVPLSWGRQLSHNYLGLDALTKKGGKIIGDAVAIKMEAAFDLPAGWMDQVHDELIPLREDSDSVDVPSLAIAAPLGLAQPERVDTITMVRLSKSWLKSTTVTHIEKLAVLTKVGADMAPTLGDGALLLVDQGARQITSDAIYVLQAAEQVWVKRIARRIEGGFTLLSDNSSYPPQVIERPGESGLQVLGRVVAAWDARRL